MTSFICLIFAANIGVFVQYVLHPKLLDQDVSHHGKRDREQDAHRPDQHAEGDDRKNRDGRWQVDCSLLNERRDDVSFDLLDQHVKLKNQRSSSRTFCQPKRAGRYRRKHRSDEWHELQQRCDEAKGQGRRNSSSMRPAVVRIPTSTIAINYPSSHNFNAIPATTSVSSTSSRGRAVNSMARPRR